MGEEEGMWGEVRDFVPGGRARKIEEGSPVGSNCHVERKRFRKGRRLVREIEAYEIQALLKSPVRHSLPAELL